MELSMKIDARPCNIAPEGNNIFPRFFVNVKEASRIFLITLWWSNKPAQIVRSDTCSTFRVKGRHHFRDHIGPKKTFYGNIIFKGEKKSFHVPLHPFQGAKLTVTKSSLKWIKKKKTTLKVLLFFLHVKSNL